jgi:hypothetical protein
MSFEFGNHSIDFGVVEFRAVGCEFKRHDAHPRMLVTSAERVERNLC